MMMGTTGSQHDTEGGQAMTARQIQWGPELTFSYGTALRELNGHVWDHHADTDHDLTDAQLAELNAENKADMGVDYDGSVIIRARRASFTFQIETP